MGAFNFLGVEEFKSKEFIPDFSAKVINHARVFRITHKAYQEEIERALTKKWLMA